jgi:hypothetical protein
MESNEKEQLIKELLEAESSDKEAGELLSLAKKLSEFQYIKRSEDFKRKQAEKIMNSEKTRPVNRFHFLFAPLAALVLVLTTGVTVAGAQDSVPGDVLYPLKRASEEAAIAVNPEFKSQLLERRTTEISKIVENNGKTENLQDAVREYEKEIKKEEVSKEKLEESRNRLEIAREKSVVKGRGDIEKLIQRIDEKIATDPAGKRTEVKGAHEEKEQGKSGENINNRQEDK